MITDHEHRHADPNPPVVTDPACRMALEPMSGVADGSCHELIDFT